jgi:hypothetical protein
MMMKFNVPSNTTFKKENYNRLEKRSQGFSCQRGKFNQAKRKWLKWRFSLHRPCSHTLYTIQTLFLLEQICSFLCFELYRMAGRIHNDGAANLFVDNPWIHFRVLKEYCLDAFYVRSIARNVRVRVWFCLISLPKEPRHYPQNSSVTPSKHMEEKLVHAALDSTMIFRRRQYIYILH